MDRRKSDFLATLAHELRNPLAPLRNGLQIMRMASGDEVMIGRAWDMMERQVGSLVRLVDDLLDIARISGGKIELRRERTALQDIVGRALETSTPAVEAQRHALKLRVASEPVAVDVDSTRLAQVLANIISNAAKYTPPGGQVEVAAGAADGQAFMEVVDNGVGIPKASLASVFEMFSQVRENLAMAQGGLGIGLALSRKLVELHGGTISAESAGPRSGSRFLVRLPLASGPLDDAAAGAPPTPVAARALRVLRFVASIHALQTTSRCRPGATRTEAERSQPPAADKTYGQAP